MSLRISRRGFLAGLGAAGAGALVHPQIALAAEGEAPHTLLVVVLQGGLDGLSALVPAGDPAYTSHRRQTRIAPEEVLPVDDRFGLHPSLAPIHELWGDGLVAAVPATGTATRTRSHFAEIASVAAGGVDDGTGWLTRHLITAAGGARTLHGASFGIDAPLELRGHPGAFHVRDLDSIELAYWDGVDPTRLEAAVAAAYAAGPPGLAAPAATAFEALSMLRTAAIQPGSPAEEEADPWARQLGQVARLLTAGVGVEAAVIGFGGWDTHYVQGGTDGRLAYLLDQLARALASFMAQVQDRLDRLTVVVLSEFGRRVAENGSGGTDHGRGGVAMVLGGGLHGGVHGTWPGLEPAALEDGDVAVTTDIRSVLAEVVAGRLGNPALDQVFPRFAPTPVGIV